MSGHRGGDGPDHDLQKEKDVRDQDQNRKRSPQKKSKKDTASLTQKEKLVVTKNEMKSMNRRPIRSFPSIREFLTVYKIFSLLG